MRGRWLILGLGATVLAGVGAVAWHLRLHKSTYFTDAATILLPTEAASPRDVLWRPARRLPETINSIADEYQPAVAPGGETLLFVRGRAGRNADIFFITRTPAGWSSPQPIEALNTEADEVGPALSADGRSLYFSSNRAGGSGNYDLWVSHRALGDWTPPINLGAAVNSAHDELGPALASDGATLYFASNRPLDDEGEAEIPAARIAAGATVEGETHRRDYDLYAAPVTAGTAGPAAPLAELNTAADESAPTLSPVGDFLYFASDRPQGQGGFDLYRSRRLEGGYTPPANLGSAVNTPAHELDPAIGLGGFGLHFSSNRESGPGRDDYDLYYTTSREVFRHTDAYRAAVDWASVWAALWPILLWALSLIVLLWGAATLWQHLEDRRATILAKCLLASLLLHMLLGVSFVYWAVASSRPSWLRPGGAVQVALVTPPLGVDLSRQVRGGLISIEFEESTPAPARQRYAPTPESPRPSSAALSVDRNAAEAPEPLVTAEAREAAAAQPDIAVARLEAADVLSRSEVEVEVELPSPSARADQIEVTAFKPKAAVGPDDAPLPPYAPARPQRAPVSETLLTVTRSAIAAARQPEVTVRLEDAPPAAYEDLPTRSEAWTLPGDPARVEVGVPSAETPLERAEASTIDRGFAPPATARLTYAPNPKEQTPSDASLSVDRSAIATTREPQMTVRFEDAPSTAVAGLAERSQAWALPGAPARIEVAVPSAEIAAGRAEASTTDRLVAPPAASRQQYARDSQKQPASDASLSVTPSTIEASGGLAMVTSARDAPGHAVLPPPVSSAATPLGEQPRIEVELPALAPSVMRERAETRAPPAGRLAAGGPSEPGFERISGRDPRAELAPVAAGSKETATRAAARLVFDAPPPPPAVVFEPPSAAAGRPAGVVIVDLPDLPQEQRVKAAQVERPPEPTATARAEAARINLRLSVKSVEGWLGPEPPEGEAPAHSFVVRSGPDAAVGAVSPASPSTMSLSQVSLELPHLEEPAPPGGDERIAEPLFFAPESRQAAWGGKPARTPLPPLAHEQPRPIEVTQAPLSRRTLPKLEERVPDPVDLRELDPKRAMILAAVELDLRLPTRTVLNPYAQRAPKKRKEVLKRMGGSEATEQAVALALAWLARHQSPDGRFDGTHFDRGCGQCWGQQNVKSDIALTGLSLLCFLAADHTHMKDGPYREVVSRGIGWLLARQRPNGDLVGSESLYSHGIATIALSEAYGMTGDPRLAEPVKAAVDFIYAARNQSGGGWRYTPGQFGDTSVLGWQVMALASAKRADVDVPKKAFDVAQRWLNLVRQPSRPGQYAYQPSREVTPAMTAEGMFVQQLLGAARYERHMRASAGLLVRHLPSWDTDTNTYFWYYATLALFQHQGEEWDRWNEAVKHELVVNQIGSGKAAGSWDPRGRWSQVAGRVYQTAICTLTLEVYYRYLPTFVSEPPTRR